MLTYQTQLKKLILPEYGRNIQNMVDHCLTIEDRDERTRCAMSVVAAMNVLFPNNTSDQEAYRRKLWDHLMIMSDFRLDIDLPFETLRADASEGLPDPVPYNYDVPAFRHYGRYIYDMVARATEMPEGEERDALIMLLANQMKKTMVAALNDTVDDRRIFADMAQMSHGAIRLDPENVRLHDYSIAAPLGKKKKKK